jgi:hypothetical protein
MDSTPEMLSDDRFVHDLATRSIELAMILHEATFNSLSSVQCFANSSIDASVIL